MSPLPLKGPTARSLSQSQFYGKCRSTKRWKRELEEIRHWDRFNRAHHLSSGDIAQWIAETRHKVMYKDEAKVD